jgi:hypothetical protein
MAVVTFSALLYVFGFFKSIFFNVLSISLLNLSGHLHHRIVR